MAEGGGRKGRQVRNWESKQVGEWESFRAGYCAAGTATNDSHKRKPSAETKMKLIIQIPCYNEEDTLKVVLAELPRRLAGVHSIERLVVDDGSSDDTAARAEALGVEHIVRFPSHRGLAKAFMAGLEAAVAAGADIIVNLDADNQYCAGDIPKLIQPILDGRAEMVIGSRPIGESHFSPVKKLLQRVGSRVVRWASGTAVADAPSGFRALSRNAALRMNVFGDYTYTLETIIQAGRRGITVVSVPIHTNAPLRRSRLVRSTLNYVTRSVVTILRIFMVYCPLRFFLLAGAIPVSAGAMLVIRWLVFFWGTGPASHLPSLVLAAILISSGFQLWVLGLVAELLAVNRMLLEDIQFKSRRSEPTRLAASPSAEREQEPVA